MADSPHFNRFDVCEAWYAFAAENHTGQFSPEYAIFGRLERLGFTPSLSVRERGYEALTENGRAIYRGLVERQERREVTMDGRN